MSKPTLRSLIIEHGKPDSQAAIEAMSWQMNHVADITAWFKREYALTVEAPLNTDPETCCSDDAPLITYVQQEWRVVPEQERAVLRKALPDADKEPADDYTVVCTIVNDAKIIEFMQECTPDMTPGAMIFSAFSITQLLSEMAGERFLGWQHVQQGLITYDELVPDYTPDAEV